ncbi:trypco2 family protein [Streptomyces sp. HNM0575]|uniref:trypco2 family protein n=1 Tax=Streptomyces sp. HNM0575 TaxID=2716338 RepID=UPI0019D3195E|nr:trypco2 family protein [Streptomyces sp. HNM0575]
MGDGNGADGSAHGSGDADPVPLADAIDVVRKELTEAQERATGSAWRFAVEKVTLEFAVQLRKQGDAGAGLRLGVVQARAGGSYGRDDTHRIQVELKPQATGEGERGEQLVARGGSGSGTGSGLGTGDGSDSRSGSGTGTGTGTDSRSSSGRAPMPGAD